MRVSTTIGLASAAAAVLLTVQALAQDPAPAAAAPSQPEAEAPQEVEEVVVRGRRMSEVEFELRNFIGEFVGEVAAVTPGRGYARWHRRVCVGVHNLENSAAQYIVDRISLLALEVGLEPGEPGCRPDVIAIFTTDAKTLAADMVENEPLLFRPASGGVGGLQLGLAAIDEFAESDRAVRWWHVSVPVDARTGQRAVKLSQDDTYPIVAVAGPSRLHSGIRDAMQRAVIIVDATKLTGTTWQQLGDYLAVVSLAQIDPKADPSAFDSILNLFTNPRAYSGLTDWDRSFVRALYTFNPERVPDIQVNEIISEMARQELDLGE